MDNNEQNVRKKILGMIADAMASSVDLQESNGEGLDGDRKVTAQNIRPWVNATSKTAPWYVKDNKVETDAFKSLAMALHSDKIGSKTNAYLNYGTAKDKMLEINPKAKRYIKDYDNELSYTYVKWDKMVNRFDPTDKRDASEVKKLPESEQKKYKYDNTNIHIGRIWNLEQSSFSKKVQEELTAKDMKMPQKELARKVNENVKMIKENLVPITKESTLTGRFDAKKDRVYISPASSFPSFEYYVQDLYRNVSLATGHIERLGRDVDVKKDQQKTNHRGEAIHDSRERLMSELISAAKMIELGLPASISPENIKYVEEWKHMLKEDPGLRRSLEKDLNKAVNMIRAAEGGARQKAYSEKLKETTKELQENKNIVLSSKDAPTLKDVLSYGGIRLVDANFPGGQEEKQAFLDKYETLKHLLPQIESGLEEISKLREEKDVFPSADLDYDELIDIAYTQKVYNPSAKVEDHIAELLGSSREDEGQKNIYPELNEQVSRKDKIFLVVEDPKTRIADVVLPEYTGRGGSVGIKSVGADGKETMNWHNFKVSPDEIMNPVERREAGAKVMYGSLPGFSKKKITEALQKQDNKIDYVRFFAKGGTLGYDPADSYFRNKRVYTAQLLGNKLHVIDKINVSNAAAQAYNVSFINKPKLVRLDKGEWALKVSPTGESPFMVNPTREEVNAVFEARRISNYAADQESYKLAQKYYAMAAKRPELKEEIFGKIPAGVDVSKINSVRILPRKESNWLLAASIGEQGKAFGQMLTDREKTILINTDKNEQCLRVFAANKFADAIKQDAEASVNIESLPEDIMEMTDEEAEERIKGFWR